MNEWIDVMNRRRSIRAFTGEPVPEAALREIINCGMHAPSAFNRQPWRFLSITGREKLLAIQPLCQWWGMLKTAGAAIVTCADRGQPGDIPEAFFTASCHAAAENMLLAAHALGLGAVWLGVCPESPFYGPFCDTIGLPEGLAATSMIAVGRPAEEKPYAERFDAAKWVRESFQ